MSWNDNWITRNAPTFGAWSSCIQIILTPFVIAALIVGFFQLRDYLQSPDLHLKFSNPSSLVYTIDNIGSATADQPSFGFGIFDLDIVPIDTVPIQMKEISYVKSNSSQGPNQLMSPHGKKGHRYFGFGAILCKNCKKEKWYWIYFTHGNSEGAWVVPLPDDKKNLWNPRLLLTDSQKFIDICCPEELRTPIK